jgi:acyl carrier protein
LPAAIENFNFIEAGVMDSLAFVDFIEEIERKFSIEVNFHDIDPTEFTSIGGMLRHLNGVLK